MGYSCECYALRHDALRELIGSGRKEVASEIIDSVDDIFNGDEPEEKWRPALRALIAGPRGRALAKAWAAGGDGSALPPVEASDAEALAIVAMVRFLGDRGGELGYTSSGGNLFRAIFDPAFQPTQFAVPALAPRLLQRPLAGLIHHDYPAWGGWTRAEIRAAIGGQIMPAAAPQDSDQQEWLQELADMLLDLQDEKTDLVTLFV